VADRLGRPCRNEWPPKCCCIGRRSSGQSFTPWTLNTDSSAIKKKQDWNMSIYSLPASKLTVSSITQDYMSEFQATWLHLLIITEGWHSQSLQVCPVSSRHFSAVFVLATLPCPFKTFFCMILSEFQNVFVGLLVINFLCPEFQIKFDRVWTFLNVSDKISDHV
jgi:hypothetical protein